MDALKYIFFLGLFCVSECNNMHGVVAPGSYDERLRESLISSKSTQSRINVFQSIIDGITNFTDFRAAKKSIITQAKQSIVILANEDAINTINQMFAAKEKQLENAIATMAVNAGATSRGAQNIAKAARYNEINKTFKGLTYLTEVISCRSSNLYLEGSYCAQNFREYYNPLGLVKLLLENGADPNQPSVIEMIEDVEENGVLVKKKVVTIRTPLMAAAEARNLAVVNVLLKHGARAEDSYKGYTALDVAQASSIGNRNREVIEALKKAMPK